MTGFDLSTISDCYVGSSPASAIYLGNIRIWPDNYLYQHFNIVALESGKIKWNPTVVNHSRPTLYYSTDRVNWNIIDSNGIDVTTGQKIYFKRTGYPNTDTSDIYTNGIGNFETTCLFNVEGNIMSLLFGDNFGGITSLDSNYNWAFHNLFYDCRRLKNAENLILPATTLSDYCYDNMFSTCINLMTSPALPATTLGAACYREMFEACALLTETPALPATTLAEECYREMFASCINLTTITSLAPTTLAEGCCESMFELCDSLRNVPSILPATSFPDSCYTFMFQDCTSLTRAPEIPDGTLIPPSGGGSSHAFIGMFKGCTHLNYVKCLIKQPNEWNMISWLDNVSSTGNFYKDANATWTSGKNGIPANWTIHNV